MRQQGIKILLFVFFILTAVNAVQLQHTMSTCCNEGAQHAGDGESCETIDSKAIPDLGFEGDEEDMKHCRVMMRSCCAMELRMNVCSRGMTTRAYVGSCDRVPTDGCTSVEKTCCECCELGMKAYRESIPCDQGTNLGTECAFAFRECCQRARNENDVDQCILASNVNHRLCSVKCVNVIGSYVCECPDGMVLALADNMTCVREDGDEVDPCDSARCEHSCVPSGGLYTCVCNEGYTLQADGYSCLEDGHSTSLACMWANCESNCRPVGTDSYECYCDDGFELASDGTSCIDINECERQAEVCPSDQACVNTHGFYRCDPIPNCSTGRRYSSTTSRCEDIDECQDEGACPLHKECLNYERGYYCRITNCIVGQRFNPVSRQCLDVDECALGLHNCGEGFRCDNSPGSFRCTRIASCGTGYTINSHTQECEDINECLQNADDCPPRFYCQNTLGTYKCRPCREGFRADAADGCTIDVNECEDQPDACQPDQTCVNSYGSYRCTPGCPRGYTYSDYFGECHDINECILGLHGCQSNQICQNQEGTYKCSCLSGRTFNEETLECNDIDECQIGTHNCRPHEQCFNFEGSFTCQQRCQRNYRYNATLGCVDINECEKPVYPCMGNSQCINMPGTFRCQQCPLGRTTNRVTRRCEDVNECNFRSSRCMGGCMNTIGSFTCTCPRGYELADRYNCRDINECARNIHNCSSQSACFDTRGGFKCKNIQCPQYYRKNIFGQDVRCVKEHLCPNHDLACINNKERTISYSNLARSDLSNHAVNQPYSLSTLQVRNLNNRTVHLVEFLLTQGNELGLFSIEKRNQYSPIPNNQVAIGTLYLMRPLPGPYEVDLRIEMTLFNQNREVVQISTLVLSIDVSANPF